jgi:hypothetical protein
MPPMLGLSRRAILDTQYVSHRRAYIQFIRQNTILSHNAPEC